ncbi:CHAT domain-containing tetratricopeptide repeat protein [Mangrovibacterium marinum]|uniref:CHAT domain-containing protein n=1 Tax=Mangrovibacterium marinum TaxID=1639118 RepID=A0A2T5BZS0_9BACT|nr:CHAT domain-containing tetratricopeptide repeat protein [Mangrovibacterium marinum]PTN07799.1 CHAT domain-containing protein [Mangrovibacterium marinum]
MKKRFVEVCNCPIIRSIYCCVFFVFFQSFLALGVGAIENRPTANDSIQAIAYNRKGIAAARLGDFEKARDYFERMKACRIRQYGSDSYRLGSSIINIGIQNKNLGNYDAAIENYLEAERLYVNHYSSEYPRLGFVYGNLSTIYKIRGDYLKAYEYNQNAFRLLSKDLKHYSRVADQARSSLAESLLNLKRYDEAIRICQEGLNKTDLDIRSYNLSLLAQIYWKRGEIETADKYYKETFDLLKNTDEGNQYDLGLELVDYVKFLLSAKKYEEVPHYNELSREAIRRYFTERSTQYANVMLNYADYYASRSSEASHLADFNRKRAEDLKLALTYYQKALIAATGTFTATDPFENPEIKQAISELQLLEILKKKSQCHTALGDLLKTGSQKQEAVRHYQAGLEAVELAVELVHQIRTGFVSEESRLFLSENQQSTFVGAINLCYKLYQQTGKPEYVARGFELTEKSKSASFLAAVKDSRAQQFGGIPDSLLNKEDVLKINISNYKQMLYEEKQQAEPDSEKVALYNTKIFYYSEKYAQLVQLLEDSFPKYYAFKYANEVIGLDAIRDRIGNHDAIVEYFIDEPDEQEDSGSLFRFVITNEQFSFSKTPIDSTFSNRIEGVYQFLTSSSYQYTDQKSYADYAWSSYCLYNDLLGDVQDELEGKTLVVIPDDKLSYIPFDALIYEEPDTSRMNFRNLAYLIKKHSISYTYSTTLLFDYFDKEQRAEKSLLAFAPSYEKDDRDYTVVAEYRAGLLPLLAVDKEVEYINEYVQGDLYEDSLAQEAVFKKYARDYDVLHLAMHTIVNDTLPMYSRLAFSKPTANTDEDGWLNTSEIYNMQLNARMAVLSACNTGSGKLQKGEGVMSLARGFLYAGCPSIVMTLWEVEDESGANIMRDFYKYLSVGKDKAEALRLAKLAHIENADPLKAHPHFWLAYVAVGNTSPLYVGKEMYWLGALALVLVMLIVVDQMRRKRRKTQD